MREDQQVEISGASTHSGRGRWGRFFVHVALLATLAVSLVFETVLTIHIVVGLAFVGFVVAHVIQRRRTSARLLRRLPRFEALLRRPGRMAWADALLAALTLGMLVSGFWDWSIGHPTKIRWHALTGVALAILVLSHTIRRRKRVVTSRIR